MEADSNCSACCSGRHGRLGIAVSVVAVTGGLSPGLAPGEAEHAETTFDVPDTGVDRTAPTWCDAVSNASSMGAGRSWRLSTLSGELAAAKL